MENQSQDIFTKKALEFCQQNVYRWSELDESIQAWYIGTISQMLKQNKEVIQILLQARLN